MGQGQLIGDEDVVMHQQGYQTTVRCLSAKAELYEIRQDEFLKLQQMGPNAWKEVVKNVSIKRQKIVELLLHARHSSKHIEEQIDKDID